MKKPRIQSLPGLGLLLALFAGSVWAQQTSAASTDQELKQVEQLIEQARKEIQQFQKDGGKTSDPNHPATKWAAVLWEYRERHAGTPAAAKAASEAVHFLVHADRVPAAVAKADTVKPDDPTWEQLIGILFEAASIQKDYEFFVRKTQSLLRNGVEEKLKPSLHFSLGRAYWQQGDFQKAKEAFQTVLERAPGSSLAKQAEGSLYELTQLAPGRLAPPFEARERNGSLISLAAYRGKAVLLIFWATT